MNTAEEVRRWLAQVLPDQKVTSVRRLGAGLDHVAWVVDESLVVRVAKASSEQTRRDAALLELVSRVSPIPTPRVVLVSAEALVCTFLTGTSLLERDSPPVPAVARQLGELLTALHGEPRANAASLVEVDEVAPQAWLDEARAQWPIVLAMVSPEHVPAIESFLGATPPAIARQFVFCHNDLGSEHLLASADGLLTGVIDWSDAALADPAVDFARLHRDFGPDFARSVRTHYALALDDEDAWERIEFYARCSAIEDLAFAHETNDERYRRAALRSLGHLFGRT